MAGNDNSNEIMRVKLGFDRYAVVNEFQNRSYLHLRVYATSTDGRSYPTLKGVALNSSRFAMLKMLAEEIEEQVQLLNTDKAFSYTSHLGGGIYCSVKSDYPVVDFRKHFVPEGQTAHIPTRKGISLKINEWKVLKSKLDEIAKSSAQLENAVPCCFSSYHSNQETNALCTECNPFQLHVGEDI